MFKKLKGFMTIDDYTIDQINLALSFWDKDKEVSEKIIKNLVSKLINYQIKKYITGE